MPNLIIFARAPVLGEVKTRLGSVLGSRAALSLYRAMLEDLAETLRAAKWLSPVWWVEGDEAALRETIGEGWAVRTQPGGSLGERQEKAIEATCAASGTPLAVIGTDCPALGQEALEALFASLEGGYSAAVIPAEDGGYAGLALREPVPGLFDSVPWSCPETLSKLLSNLTAKGVSTKLLHPLPDVDEPADLYSLPAWYAAKGKEPGLHLFSALKELALDEGEPPSVVDDLGRVVRLKRRPRRIVSLVPSATEMFFDFGLGESVVGRTDYCISPAGLVEKIPSVGGPKTIDTALVETLQPDLVFADAEENDKEGVERLIRQGVPVFVALPRTLYDVAALLRRLGKLCEVREVAEKAAQELMGLAPRREGAEPAVCLVWKEPFVAVTHRTLSGALMEAAGFSCLLLTGGGLRYPRLKAEELAALRPKVLMLPTEPYPFTESEAEELKEAFPHAAPLVFPGEWVTWYGLRTFGNIQKLSELREKL